jgi:serine/threonine protein kinase/Tol biopolymer transport system component
MALAPGTRLGPYEIGAQIGVGGMGEVYRARDTQLQRDVAIKVLPEALAHDSERLARFEREAKTLAALNHPNIAHIHGLQESDGTKALVMELVEGPTLADRIAHGAIPVDEALPIARQIAEGLEAAHEQGIIHRDLKPANVKVRPDGIVKVLDFGLAKVLEPAIVTVDGSQAPTITSPAMTQAGVILGTAAYMSPEQAKGKPADKRSDIWAFGCVLYEMLTGTLPFPGDHMTETLASVVRAEPDWEALPATPSKIRTLVFRCLQKDIKKRTRDAGDIVIELDEATSAVAMSIAPPASVTRILSRRASFDAQARDTRDRNRYERLGWIVAAVVLLTTVGGFVYTRRSPVDAETIRFFIPPPQPATDIRDPAISPDGSRLAFVAAADWTTMVWVRALRSLAAEPLPYTEGASLPFWSPDSKFIGFFAAGKLKKIALSGGPATTLADAPMGVGGTWNRDGTILFTPRLATGVYRVPDAGGDVEAVSLPDPSRHENSHTWPSFLPDGRHFLYFAFGSQAEEIGIYVASLDGRDRRRLVSADSGAIYAPPGFLIYVRGSTLLAQPFDATDRRVTGEPFRLADPLPNIVFNYSRTFSVSDSDVLVYVESASRGSEQLAWFDRTGTALGMVGSPGTDLVPALSPDETRLAMSRLDPETQNADLWLLDLRRGTESRFTYDAATDHAPVWSPDSSRIVWNSNREGQANLYQKAASGEGQDSLLFKADHWKWANDWSRDGRFIIYNENNPESNNDLWILPLDGDRKPFAWRQMPFHEREARFSPDSKWIAYVSNESGNDEVYVAAFPTGGKSQVVSIEGGRFPRWRGDGKELFYVDSGGTLMSVDVTGETTFEAGVPKPLFHLRSIKAAIAQRYAVTGDGQRFLLVTNPEGGSIEPFTVVLNWTKELRP